MLGSPVSHRHTHQAPSGTEERGREGGRVEGRGEKEKEKGRRRKDSLWLRVAQVQLRSKAFYKTLYKIEDCYVRI